ncbi:diacylglycerol/lipid kinase family protein [Marinobacter caseinilyticus]|uniref:diacylglycerol/lipid kinase family protein n=1 Tax=Marinobacter caseinilyticus TaxID=2692195 RepID=UPI00140DFD25|nr:YegS/Rv2252/BmrU family lipid kinase [Marinobacter caseinilyticus]
MTIWLIANPQAGSGDRGETFWCPFLAAAGLAEPSVCDLNDTAWVNSVKAGDWLLAAGGDGTVNKTAAICLSTGGILGVLPSGTANDFARNLALPEDPQALCDLIAEGHTRPVDVAWANGQMYLNVCHIGMGTWPVREATSELKQRWGRLGYARVLLGQYRAYRGFRAAIRCQQAWVKGRWLTIGVATGAFYGGGHFIPQATANDGQLDVVAVRPRPIPHLLLAFLLTRLLGRTPKTSETLVHLKGVRCDIKTRRPKTVTADGEIMGETPLEVRCEAGCLQVICSAVVTT